MTTANVKESKLKDAFINKLSNDICIDWEFSVLSTRNLVIDTLYLLGVSINKKYSGYLGFRKFLKENNVELNLAEIPNE